MDSSGNTAASTTTATVDGACQETMTGGRKHSFVDSGRKREREIKVLLLDNNDG